jgi:hypothetical protein
LRNEETRVFHRNHSLSILAVALVCVSGHVSAQTRKDHADADAYPCTTHPRLTVIQDAQGFSIADASTRKPQAPVIAKIPLGAHLTFDRTLFAEATSVREEADAPRH